MAWLLRRSEQTNHEWKVGAGSTLIAGGLLSLVLAPFTLGGSVAVAGAAVGGAALSLGASISVLAEEEGRRMRTRDLMAKASREYNILLDDMNSLNTLLALLIYSSVDAYDEEADPYIE